MKPRPDLLTQDSPEGLEVFQLTTDPEVPSAHIYMEAQIFTPDSGRFVLHRSAHPHGSDVNDPNHQYLLCDVEDGTLTPLTFEVGATAPSVSPDGAYLYYVVDETTPGRPGRVTLKRVGLDGPDRETLFVIDGHRPEFGGFLSKIYPLSTISSDGMRIAIAGFLGDGTSPNAPWGFVVFDLVKASYQLVLRGPTWCNPHPQFCRSLDPDRSHDILVQENHGCEIGPGGEYIRLVSGDGADIHVIRDDGTDVRNMPWGRDGNEFCQGHQCWIGRSDRAVTSTVTVDPDERQLIAGRAAPHAGHNGKRSPGGMRNDLSRAFTRPDFYHFATDIAGERLITDSGPFDQGGRIFLANLPAGEDEAIPEFRFLLNPKSSWRKESHIHPFLSPDGSAGFFNSDESGILQAYMVRGW